MVFVGLFAVLALILLSQGQGQAQTLTHSTAPKVANPNSGTVSVPANYMSAPEAISVVESHSASIKSFLITLVPGTQAYKTVETNYAFYSMILSGLFSGLSVPASIQHGMTLFQYPDYLNTPNSQKQSLYTEATDLLTN